MKHTNIPIVIFAGGKSSRMTEDKALLPFAGYDTLAAYQFQRLSKLFDEVYLSAKDKKFNFKAPLIIDRYKVYSPLSGIISVFETLDIDAVFILSVDTPFVTETIIHTILEAWDGEDAVIAKNHGEAQPLCGIYSRTMLSLIQREMARGNHTLKRVLASAHTKYITFKEEKAFINLNYPWEYRRAKKIISS